MKKIILSLVICLLSMDIFASVEYIKIEQIYDPYVCYNSYVDVRVTPIRADLWGAHNIESIENIKVHISKDGGKEEELGQNSTLYRIKLDSDNIVISATITFTHYRYECKNSWCMQHVKVLYEVQYSTNLTLHQPNTSAPLIPAVIAESQTICYSENIKDLAAVSAQNFHTSSTVQNTLQINYQNIWEDYKIYPTNTNLSNTEIYTAQEFNTSQKINLNETKLRIKTTDNYCLKYQPIYSNEVSIKVQPMTLNPGSITPYLMAKPGQLPGRINSLTDAEDPVSYKWQRSANGSTWQDIAGITAASYQPPILDKTTYYRRQAVSVCANNPFYLNYSNVCKIEYINPGQIPAEQVICHGTLANKIEGSLPNVQNPIYSWQEKTASGQWEYITGATDKDYKPNLPLTEKKILRRTVTRTGWQGYSISNEHTITVLPAAAGSLTISAEEDELATVIEYGSSDKTKRVNIDSYISLNTDYSSFINYVAEFYTGHGWQEISSYKNNNQVLVNSSYFNTQDVEIRIAARVMHNNVIICEYVSNTIRFNLIYPKLKINSSISTCAASSFEIKAAEYMFGKNYQWQSSDNGTTTWADIPGQITQTYRHEPTNDIKKYYRLKYETSQHINYTNICEVHIIEPINLELVGEQELYWDDIPDPITLLQNNFDINSNVDYNAKWYKAVRTAAPQLYLSKSFPSKVKELYFNTAANSTSTYHIEIEYGPKGQELCALAISNPVTIKAGFRPGIIKNNGSDSYREGQESAYLINYEPARSADALERYSYQWQRSTNGISWADMPEHTEPEMQPGPLFQSAYYRRKATSSVSNEAKYSNVIKLTVYPVLNGNLTISAPDSACLNALFDINMPEILDGLDNYPYYRYDLYRDNRVIASYGRYDNMQTYEPTIQDDLSTYNNNTYFLKLRYGSSALNIFGELKSANVNVAYHKMPLIGNSIIINYPVFNIEGETATFSINDNLPPNFTYEWYDTENKLVSNQQTYITPRLYSSNIYSFVARHTCGEYISKRIPVATVSKIKHAGTISINRICREIHINNINVAPTSNGYYIIEGSNDKETWQIVSEKNILQGLVDPSFRYYRRRLQCHWIDNNFGLSNVVENQGFIEPTPSVIPAEIKVCINNPLPSFNAEMSPNDINRFTADNAGFQISENNVNWYPINTSPLIYDNGQIFRNNAYIRHMFAIPGCHFIYSNNTDIIVMPELEQAEITTIINDPLCPTDIPPLLEASLPAGGDGIYKYQWQETLGNTENFVNIANANSLNFQPPALGQNMQKRYRIITSADGCGELASDAITIYRSCNLEAGLISATADTVCKGATVTLEHTTSSSCGTGVINFRWQRSSNGNIWLDIAGQTSNKLTAVISERAYYRLAVIDRCTTLFTNTSIIEIYEQLEPGNIIKTEQNICYGSKIEPIMPTNAHGRGELNYEWQLASLVSDYVTVSNKEHLSSFALYESSLIKRTVFDGCGSASTGIVQINVSDKIEPGLIGSSQLLSYNSIANQLIGSAAAGGTGTYNYQWQISEDNINYYNLENTNQTNYAPGRMQKNTSYRRAVFSGNCGPEISNTVELTVFDKLYAGSIELDGTNTICYNSVPQLVKTAVSYLGGSGPYLEQFLVSQDGSTWAESIYQEGNQLQLPRLQQRVFIKKRVIATASADTAYTNILSINVFDDMSTELMQGDQTICAGTDARTIFGPLATGGSGSHTYQWQISDDANTWADLEGKTGYNLEPGKVAGSSYFRRKTIDRCGSIASTPAFIEVTQPLLPGNINTALNETCAGITAGTITGTSAAGGSGNYMYRWYISYDSLNYFIVPQSTNQNLPTSEQFRDYFIKRTVQSINCPIVDSEPVKISVFPKTEPGTIGVSQTVCYNAYPKTLNNVISRSGGSGTYTYRWHTSSDGLNYTPIQGEIQSFMSMQRHTENKFYKREVLSANCPAVYTNEIMIQVREPLRAPEIITDTAICYNTAASVIMINRQPAGGTGSNYEYSWEHSTNSTRFHTIENENTISYSAGLLSGINYYRLKVTDPECEEIYSNTVKITEAQNFRKGSITADNTVLVNTLLNITGTPAAGGVGQTTYNFQISENGSGYTTFLSTNDFSAEFPINTNISIRRIDDNYCSIDTTNIITITALTKLDGGKVSENQSICYNTVPKELIVYGSGGCTDPYTYRWQRSQDGITWADIASGVTENYQPPVMQESASFRRKTICAGYDTAYSEPAHIQVLLQNENPQVVSPYEMCLGAAMPQLYTVSNINSYDITWQRSTNGISWAAHSENSISYPDSVQGKIYYRAKGVNKCGIKYSEPTYVHVKENVQAGHIAADRNTIISRSSAYISGAGTAKFYRYQISYDSVSFIDAASNKDFLAENLLMSIFVRRIDYDECTSDTTNTIKITVLPAFTEALLEGMKTLCYNNNRDSLNPGPASGGSGNYTYRWQRSSNGSSWEDILILGTSQHYIVNNEKESFFIRRSAINTGFDTAYTQVYYYEILPELRNPVLSAGQDLCMDQVPVPLNLQKNTFIESSVKWFISDNNYNYAEIENNSETLLPAQNRSMYYKAEVHNNCGVTTSNYIRINYESPIEAGSIRTDNLSGYNKIPAPVVGSHTLNKIEYQISYDSVIYFSSGVNTINYQPPRLIETAYIRRIESTNCSSDTSNTVKITVLPKLEPGTAPSYVEVCYQSDAQAIFPQFAIGGTGTYNYQWQISEDANNWIDIAVRGNYEFYEPRNVVKSSYYRRRVNSHIYDTAYSNITYVTVYQTPANPILTENQTICANTQPNVLRIENSQDYNYQWQISNNNAAFLALNDTLNKPYFQPGKLLETIYYRARMQHKCGIATSNSVKIDVYPHLTKSQIELENEFAEKNKQAPLVIGNTVQGGNGDINYIWQRSVNDTVFTNIINNHTVNYQPPALRESVYIRRLAQNSCSNDTSNTVFINVLENISSGTPAINQTICHNTTPEMLNPGEARGCTGEITYQWQRSANGSSWQDMLGETSANILLPPLTETTYFRRAAKDNYCETVYTDATTITVRQPLIRPEVSMKNSYCKYETAEIILINRQQGYTYSFFDKQGYIGTSISYKRERLSSTDTMKIVAHNEINCASDTLAAIMFVEPVQALFEIDTYNIEQGSAVRFINLSTYADKFIWNFFDGDRSFEHSPSHYYNSPATASVKLIASSNQGCTDTLMMRNIINITSQNEAVAATATFDSSEKAIRYVIPYPHRLKLVCAQGITHTDRVSYTAFCGEIFIDNIGVYILEVTQLSSSKSVIFKLLAK
jgi:hypothetical protein